MNAAPLPKAMRDDLRGLRPYHVEKPPGAVRLDANESPFDLPPTLKAELAQALMEAPLNRYPDGQALELKRALAESLNADAAQIAVGNGSDELIAALITALARSGMRVVSPTPSFSMYRISAQVAGAEYVGVPLLDNFELDEAAMHAAVSHDGWSLVFLSYPNNPTGNCWDREAILRLAERERTIVAADEAYVEFSGKTFLDSPRSNLLILRTFSKAFGLAALRVGFMIGGAEWVECIDRVRLPYNVNAFSQLAASALWRRRGYAASRVEAILHERARVFKALEASPLYKPFPTEANFILFRALKGGQAAFEQALERGVLLRNLNKPGPLQDCLRATIGSPAENRLLMEALDIA